MLSIPFLLAGLALPAQILGLVVHEALEAVPHGWTHVADAAGHEKIALEVELQMNNIDKMVEALYAVSTPTNAKYGQHWTREQVNALVSPSDEALQATVGWANVSGVDIATTWHSVKLSTTVAKANKLLNTKFAYYEQNGVRKLRTTRYSVHEDVAQHIDLIHPTTFFGNTKSMAHGPVPIPASTGQVNGASANCTTALTPNCVCTVALTPNCVKQLYNVPLNYTPYNDAGASVAFGSFLGQSARESDSAIFEARFGIPKQTFKVVLINGGVNLQNGSADHFEANLDAQNIVGVSHPLPITEYITGGYAPFIPDLVEPVDAPSNEPYLQYYNYLLSLTNQELPGVISNSYGDIENTVPKNYAIRTCNLMGMMGLRGISILESSGDNGVGAVCLSQDKNPKVQFEPIFPATCPYVTAVGGTQNIPERAWVGSSGGFSFYFPRASYQQTAINTYLDEHVSSSTALYYSQYTNFSGRGFPDISAMSVEPYYYIYYDGGLYGGGGTSAASPVVAGMIALLNDYRLKHGRPSLGFLNPYLYSSGYKALRDITTGQSIGCNGNDTQFDAPVPGAGIIPYSFWNATKGWDPVTGWGVPNFQKMLNTWGRV